MRSHSYWSPCALLLVCPLLVSGPAHAQDIAAAEALFDKGVEDMQAGRYETGCKAIAESQRIDPRPGTVFTLATCEARRGLIATAASRYADYLALYDGLSEDRKAAHHERRQMAIEAREKLLKEVPYLTLSLPKGAPAGTIVKRNGEEVGQAALGLSLPVDPGEHILSTHVPGGPVHEQKIKVAKGEKKLVTLEVKAVVVEQPPAGVSGRRMATYVVGGVGLAGLVVGGVLGGVAVAQRGVMDEHCGAGIGQTDKTACDQMGFDASNIARPAAAGSTIGLAVGGAALGAALVLFITEPKMTPPNASAPVAGKPDRWGAAGVISVGPAGAMLGVKGAW